MSYIPNNPPLIVTGSSFTRPSDTNIYAFGDLIANSTTAGSVVPSSLTAARGNDIPGTILRCRLQKSGTSTASAIFRLHLYQNAPTCSNGDNSTWLTTSSGYLGSIDVTVDKVFSDISEGTGVPTTGSTIAFNPSAGTQTIYCLIEARTSYTPIASEVFTPILEVQ